MPVGEVLAGQTLIRVFRAFGTGEADKGSSGKCLSKWHLLDPLARPTGTGKDNISAADYWHTCVCPNFPPLGAGSGPGRDFSPRALEFPPIPASGVN